MAAPLRVVLLTPPGRGAIASLLVEGSAAADLVRRHFRTPGTADRELQTGRFGPDPSERVVARFRADGTVEVHCHGGDAAVGRIRNILVAEGAVPTDWQTWLAARAADPIEAEAAIALAKAPTERTAAALLDQHRGALTRELTAIRGKIARGETEFARRAVETLLARAEFGRHLTEPWRVLVAGRPNVGKSSLLNALLGYARAIVHATPGTTRDVVSATTAIDGWPIELADTAGLRETDDPIEQAGIELARRQMESADLVLLVFDASEPWSEADARLLPQHAAGALVVHNKWDRCVNDGARPEGLRVSALTGTGMDELCRTIAGRLVPSPPPKGAAVPFTSNQIAHLNDLLKLLG